MALLSWCFALANYITTFVVMSFPVILLLCMVSSLVLFYVKACLFGVFFAFVCTLIVLISLRSPGAPDNINYACNYVRWMIGIWGIKINVRGRENMREDSNYIVVCNHQSMWDLAIMLYVLPKNIRVMVKKEISYMPFIGWVAWIGGAIFVDRHNHDKALDVLNEAVSQIEEEKCSVWIYPEGTRHQGKTLLPFKKGGFHLAQRAQVPILPIVFSDYASIINFKEKRFLTGTVDITIFPAISTEGLKPSDVDQLIDRVRRLMCEEFERKDDNSNSMTS